MPLIFTIPFRCLVSAWARIWAYTMCRLICNVSSSTLGWMSTEEVNSIACELIILLGSGYYAHHFLVFSAADCFWWMTMIFCYVLLSLVFNSFLFTYSYYLPCIIKVYVTLTILNIHMDGCSVHLNGSFLDAFSVAAHIPLYLYPFLNTTSKTRPFEYLRLTSLGVIGALVKVFLILIQQCNFLNYVFLPWLLNSAPC